MIYQYHVAYASCRPDGATGFGSVDVSLPTPLASPSDVTKMGRGIARGQGFDKVVVLNVIAFGPSGEAGEEA